MRLLFVQPMGDKMGHYASLTSKLCQALSLTGDQVTLFTNSIDPARYIADPVLFNVRCFGGSGLSFRRFDAAKRNSPAYYYYGHFRNSYLITNAALSACSRANFDAVFVADAEFGTASLVLRRHAKQLPPVAMQINAANFSFADYDGNLVQRSYKALQRQLLRSVLGNEIKGLAVLGEWHKRRLREQLRLSSRFPIEVLPDGGDDPAISVPREEARRRLGIGYSGPLFGLLGIIRRDKGLESLLDAASKLPREDFRVLVAGNPADYSEPEIKALAAQPAIADRVNLRLGYLPEEELGLCYLACDAVTLPYRANYTGGSGGLYMGACVYGRPVIASDIGDIGSIVRDHDLGLLSAPENPQALSLKMQEFLRLPSLKRERLGANARKLGQRNTWTARAEGLNRLFREARRYAAAS